MAEFSETEVVTQNHIRTSDTLAQLRREGPAKGVMLGLEGLPKNQKQKIAHVHAPMRKQYLVVQTLPRT